MDTILRTAKQYIEQFYFQATEAQLFNRLFNVSDESTDAGFVLDKLVGSPYAVTYRAKDAQARVMQYSSGSGVLIEPPIASVKTPITEDLLDKVQAGVEATGGFGRNEAQIVNGIVRQHVSAINMLKNKQALDVLADGVFYALGPVGQDVAQSINFYRNSALNMTYDFTGDGATLTLALTQAQTTLIEYGMPMDSNVCIMGASWISTFSTDTAIQAYTLANQSNVLLTQQMMPQSLLGIEGLQILGQYRGAGMIAPILLCAYQPPIAYVKDEGQTAEAYIAADEAIFFNLSDIRYKVNRGIVALDEMGQRVRAVGDIVTDRFNENDPVVTYLRSATRHCFVPGLVNRTGKMTGTFS